MGPNSWDINSWEGVLVCSYKALVIASGQQFELVISPGTMSPLLLMFVGLASAVTPENIRIIQHQSAVVAEASLQQTMSRCMLK